MPTEGLYNYYINQSSPLTTSDYIQANYDASPTPLADASFASINQANQLPVGWNEAYSYNQPTTTSTPWDFSGVLDNSQVTSSPYTDYMNQEGLFGLTSGTWGNIGTLGKLGTGLANAYLGYKQLGLAQDTFAFNKDMKEKEYAMAKDAYDRQVARASSIGNQMQAGAVK